MSKNNELATTESVTPPPKEAAGPIEMGSWSMRTLTTIVKRDNRKAGLVLEGLLRVGYAAAERTYIQALPLLCDLCADVVGMSPMAHARFRAALQASVPLLPLDITAGELNALGQQIAELDDPNSGTIDEGVGAILKRVMKNALTSAFGRGSRPPVPLPPGCDYFKVGSLERPAVLPPQDGYPLFCVEPCDWGREDEPRGAELTYRGLHWLGLDAPTDSVSQGPVRGVWLQDWSDLPENWKESVEVGLHVHYYTWFLTEYDGITDHSKLEKKIREDLRKLLADKQKDLIDKAQKAVEDMLKGTQAAPAAQVAGQITVAVLNYVLPFIVAILTDNTFAPVSLSHLTFRASPAAEPLSLVLAFTRAGILPISSSELVVPGDHVNPIFKTLPTRSSDFTSCRWWWGASTLPPTAPLIVEDVGRAKHPASVMWSKTEYSGEAPEGFHIMIPLTAPTRKPLKRDGIYVVALRADTRIAPSEPT